MSELVGLYILLGAVVVAALGWLWLLILAWQNGRGWFLAVFLFPPAALLFIPTHARRSVAPLCVLLFAGILGAVPYVANLAGLGIDLGPRDKRVEGERHITLTGWDRKDYSILEKCPDVVVLQMANPDVTDETLRYLKGLKNLRELDLNDTRVTDEGLAVLAELPALKTLRLRKTAITDEGFRRHLLGKKQLTELDLTGTKVASRTVREWRAAQTGRKALP
jgi:Leucine-rich repeat (LRR) protein